MYGICVVLGLIIGVAHGFLEGCVVDNSICTNPSPPKMEIEVAGNLEQCNKVLTMNQTTLRPNFVYTLGTEGDFYLVVMIDPDAPQPCAHVDGSANLHYTAVVLLDKGYLKPQEVVFGYHPPHPRVGTHRYQLFLFPWAANETAVLQPRHDFKLNKFQNENHLYEPEAVFQFKVPRD